MAFSKLSFLITGRRRQTSKWGSLVTLGISSSFSSSVNTHTFSCQAAKPIQNPSNSSSSSGIFNFLPKMNNLGSLLSPPKIYGPLPTQCDSPVDKMLPVIRRFGMTDKIKEMEYSCSEMMKLTAKGTGDDSFEEKAFKEVVDPLVTSGKWDAVLRVLELIFLRQNILPGSTLVAALNYLFLHRRVHLAIYIFNKINQKTTETFEIIIYACREIKMAEECVMLLDELFELIKSSKCSPPTDIDFYARVISFLFAINEPYAVNQLLSLMTDVGINHRDLDSSSFSTTSYCEVNDNTVKGFCLLGRFDNAVKFLEEHVDPYFADKKYYVPMINIYNHLLKSCFVAGRLDQANYLFEKMVKKDRTTLDSWIIVIRTLCQENEFDKALATLKRMIAYWDERHNHADQTSTRDGFTSLFDTIMSTSYVSFHEGDGLFKLAMQSMFLSGLWKESQDRDANELGGDDGKHLQCKPNMLRKEVQGTKQKVE